MYLIVVAQIRKHLLTLFCKQIIVRIKSKENAFWLSPLAFNSLPWPRLCIRFSGINKPVLDLKSCHRGTIDFHTFLKFLSDSYFNGKILAEKVRQENNHGNMWLEKLATFVEEEECLMCLQRFQWTVLFEQCKLRKCSCRGIY